MPFPFTFPFCFDGSVCPPYWVPSLGALLLERVLDWQERKQTPIPKKRIFSRDPPSTEAEAYSDFPNKHVILCRLTPEELNTLYDLENDVTIHNLFQIQDDPAIIVWIENVEVGHAMTEHNVAYWLTSIHLVEAA